MAWVDRTKSLILVLSSLSCCIPEEESLSIGTYDVHLALLGAIDIPRSNHDLH